MIAQAKNSRLDGFRYRGMTKLPNYGMAAMLIADDTQSLSDLRQLVDVYRGVGSSLAQQGVRSVIHLNRCQECGGGVFARTITRRFHRRRTNIVLSDRLICLSGEKVIGDDGELKTCNHTAFVIHGEVRGLVASEEVHEAVMQVLHDSFTPMEEAHHRGMDVGRLEYVFRETDFDRGLSTFVDGRLHRRVGPTPAHCPGIKTAG